VVGAHERSRQVKKMPCLFQREFHGRSSATLLEAVTPGCEWVLDGEGVASIKRDGTACMVKGDQIFKRYDAKKDRKTGEYRMPPAGAIPCDDPDPVTGHWPHWTLIGEHDYWHAEAWARQCNELADGTYELCGPKISANPERLDVHTLIRHGSEAFAFAPGDLSFAKLRDGLRLLQHEGLVFAHPDGRFAKIRRKDYGFDWPAAPSGRQAE
jgi:hypothetical protein